MLPITIENDVTVRARNWLSRLGLLPRFARARALRSPRRRAKSSADDPASSRGNHPSRELSLPRENRGFRSSNLFMRRGDNQVVLLYALGETVGRARRTKVPLVQKYVRLEGREKVRRTICKYYAEKIFIIDINVLEKILYLSLARI